MKKAALSIGAVISLCGTCIAFYIGAGFATMQEIMQYEASYGSLFWVVIAITALIYVYTNLSFATNGNRMRLSRGGEIYTRYCGKHIGMFFDAFSAFFCYMCFIVMCGGAGSTVSQQWGLPNGVGTVGLTVVVVVTAVFGLGGILNTLGKVGPLIVIILLLISIISCVSGAGQFQANLHAIDRGAYALEQVGGGNPVAAGISYGGFVILWFASFLAEIGARKNLREVNAGMLLSIVFIAATAVLCCVALISHIDLTAYADIPALTLANAIHPALGQIVALIIFCGIYTTSVPLLWTGVGRLAKEGTAQYRILTVAGGAVGCIAACFLPYKRLVNILYGVNGYLGFILVAFMLVYDVRTKMGKKRPRAT